MISIYKKLMNLVDPSLKKKLIIIYLITVVGTFLETLGIGIILPVLTIIVEGQEVLKNFTTNSELINQFIDYLMALTYQELIIISMLFLISIFFVKTIFFFFLINKQIKCAHLIESMLTSKIFDHYLKQDYFFHINRNSAKLFSNITEETKNFKINLVEPFLVISTEVILLLTLLFLLVVIEPFVTLSVATFLLVISFIFIKFAKSKISIISNQRQVHESLKTQHLRQGLNGIKEIKILGKENIFLSIFNKHNLEVVNSRAMLALWTTVPRYTLEFVGIFGICALSIFLVNKGIDLKSLLPTIGLFVVAAFRLLPCAVRIVQASGKIRYGVPSADLLKNELEETFNNLDKSKLGKIDDKFKFENIKFENVSFKYPNSNENILKNIDFEINVGDIIGIIGSSGSGKSTLIDILTGLISPTEGKIILNNKIVELENKNWFKIIAYTPQFIFLTDDTIQNNIAFGELQNSIKTNNLKESYEKAELKNFIDSTSKGLNTFIGESGIRLSGGQRQRIGIARALYLNSQILVLDEATSAIDLKTEEKIINNINKLENKTVIIVSHRHSTLSKCNKVFEIKDRKLIKKNLND